MKLPLIAALALTITLPSCQKAHASFSRLIKASAHDVITYSANGRLVALASQPIDPDAPILYADLAIYDVGASFQPRKLLFHRHIKNGYIAAPFWAGNTLLYTYVSFLEPLSPGQSGRTSGPSEDESPRAADKFINIAAWPAHSPLAKSMNRMRLFLFRGGYFVDNRSGYLLVVDPLYKMTDYWDKLAHRLSNAATCQSSLDVYEVATGKLVHSTTVPLPEVASTIDMNGQWQPLSISRDGDTLMAWTNNTDCWRRPSAYDGTYLVAIDLNHQTVKPLNSEDEGQGLGARMTGNTSLSTLGAPVCVNDNDIIAPLDTSLASAKMRFRFANFTTGQQGSDVFIYDADLAKAGIPDTRFILTWMGHGQNVLLQCGDSVCRFDWKHAKASIAATGIEVRSIDQRIDDNHLLVHAQKIVGNVRNHNNQLDETGDWGVLSVGASP